MPAAPDLHVKRQALEKEMLRLEAELLAVRLSYNTLSSMNHLPNEILSKIFTIYAAETTEGCKSHTVTTHKGSSFSWIKIAHVCHQWRAVALGCAELWSTILFIEPELTELMLARSKASPISIKFNVTNRTFDKILAKVLAQTDRLQSIELSGAYNPLLLDKVGSTTSASVLETLILMEPQGRTLQIPPSFLQGGTPLLRHLTLRQSAIPRWSWVPHSPLVTHFEVSTSFLNADKLDDLLSTLQQMPLLETLIIEKFFPLNPGKSGELAHSEPITFSSMKRVRLLNSIPIIHGLMEAIRIPDTAVLEVIFTGSVEDYPTVERAITKIAAAWRRGNLLATKDLRIRQIHTYVANMLLFQSRNQNLDKAPDAIPELNISFMHPRHDVVRLIPTFTKFVVNIASLQSLRLDSVTELLENEWVDLFGWLPSLKKITLADTPFFTLCRILSRGFTPSSGPAILFPALKALALEDIDFTFGHHIATIESLAILIDALQSRTETHCIAFLDISNSKGFDQEHFDSIVMSVPHLIVNWDEREVEVVEEEDSSDEEVEDTEEEVEGE